MAAEIAVPALAETLPHTFQRAVRARGDAIAMREKRLGLWRAITWNGLWNSSRALGLGLIARGFGKGDVAAILAHNGPGWLAADLAVLCAGGVSVGLYPVASPAQVAGALVDSRAKVLFVDDEEQLDKALEIKGRCPGLSTIVVIGAADLGGLADPAVVSLDEIVKLGIASGGEADALWQARIDACHPNDPAILVYTSGATGQPRGALLSHGNVCAALEHVLSALPAVPGDERLSLLPLGQLNERILGAYAAIASGTIVNFAEGPDTAFENLRELQPTTVSAIPRVWEKLYSGIMLTLSEATRFERFAYRTAIGLGRRVYACRIAGKPVPAHLALANSLARRLVLRPIRKALGIDRARWLMTCAAPISPDLVGWYGALGATLIQVYGQAETSAAVAIMPPGRARPGAAGRVLPSVEVAISPEGEILVRGANVFQGYPSDPVETARVLWDGWLHTGDIGTLDPDGFVTVTDRIKDVLVTRAGQRIMPSEIENRLALSPYISDAVIAGEEHDRLNCLVLIDYDNVVKFAQDRGVPFTHFQSLCRAEAVQALIGAEIDKVNAASTVGRISAFRLIDEELSPGDEEITPAVRLKRGLVRSKYSHLFEARERAEAERIEAA